MSESVSSSFLLPYSVWVAGRMECCTDQLGIVPSVQCQMKTEVGDGLVGGSSRLGNFLKHSQGQDGRSLDAKNTREWCFGQHSTTQHSHGTFLT